MNDALRDKIARALFIAGDQREAEQRAKAWDAPGPHGRQQWFNYADAVLAVLDLDRVRAEAQVEALEDLATAHYLDGPQSTYDTIMRYADRIAREAGIEQEDEG